MLRHLLGQGTVARPAEQQQLAARERQVRHRSQETSRQPARSQGREYVSRAVTDFFVRLREALAARYRLERELGRGGMAFVFQAWDPKHERWVAIKVLRPELAQALGPERFLREIKVAAGLTHPNILPLYDSGEAGGFLYYVMPYVEGESLRHRLLARTRLGADEAAAIARGVADALHFAHARRSGARARRPGADPRDGGQRRGPCAREGAQRALRDCW